MTEARPDPDRLLSHVEAEEARARRGKLRIFFGAAAGVGKTYAMLEAARNARASGADLVIGCIEPHGRVETEWLTGEDAIVGVGLGLVICRAIVSAHGGVIEAGRSLQGGARFELTLPVAEPAA